MKDMEKTAQDCGQDGVAGQAVTTTERVTVALVPKAAADLARLQARSSLSKTDIVNRGISLYEFIDGQGRAGRDILVRDQATGETHLVTFL